MHVGLASACLDDLTTHHYSQFACVIRTAERDQRGRTTRFCLRACGLVCWLVVAV
jgi:hypothetical protein